MKKAFTLVEILIVMVILGILAALIIPKFQKAAEQARKDFESERSGFVTTSSGEEYSACCRTSDYYGRQVYLEESREVFIRAIDDSNDGNFNHITANLPKGHPLEEYLNKEKLEKVYQYLLEDGKKEE